MSASWEGGMGTFVLLFKHEKVFPVTLIEYYGIYPVLFIVGLGGLAKYDYWAAVTHTVSMYDTVTFHSIVLV